MHREGEYFPEFKEKKMSKRPYKYFVFAHPQDKRKDFNTIPTILHAMAIDAEREAQRLARRDPGVRFCVGVIYRHFINTPVPKVLEVDYDSLIW